jgi:hypothetical protein
VPAAGSEDLTILLGPAGQEAQTPIYTADEDTYLVGVPYLTGNLTTTAPDATLFWRLDVVPADGSDPYTANAQITPQRVAEAASGTPFFQEMMGVSIHLKPGDQVMLTVASSDPQYGHNQGRSPGPATIDGPNVWLPFV